MCVATICKTPAIFLNKTLFFSEKPVIMAVALRALAFLLLDEDDNENENKERI